MLTQAIKMQSEAALAALLQIGANPNALNRKGVSPISAAAHKGTISLMVLLVNAGADVNAVNLSGSTALIQVECSKSFTFSSFSSIFFFNISLYD